MIVTLTTEHTIPAPPDAVFALGLDPVRFPPLFKGFGPIPAIRRITLHAAPAVDATRELENSDGSRLTERITELDAPRRHAYTLNGLRPPLAWLVRAGHADWTFTATAAATHIVWRYRWELTSVLVWPLAWPLLRLCMQTAMQRCLRAMAAALQSAPETA